MALSRKMLEMVSKRLKPGMKVVSMGYPDMIAPMKDIEAMLGAKFYKLKYRDDSEEICKRHFRTERRQIPDSASFFDLLGCELDVVDIVEDRGGEIIVDLNQPWYWQKSYDIVLDIGTMEHCFNISQAAFNMAAAVGVVGGYIFHENPFNWGNHGFYNLNPTWYHDFYNENGFNLLDCRLIQRNGEEVMNVSTTSRFIHNGMEANLLAVATRIEKRDAKKLRFPVQTKYKAVIPAAGVRARTTPVRRAIGE